MSAHHRGPRPPATAPVSWTPERVLSRLRHPSYCSDRVEELVRGLPRDELRPLWDVTTAVLGRPLADPTRFDVVVLRHHLASRLDELDPRTVHR